MISLVLALSLFGGSAGSGYVFAPADVTKYTILHNHLSAVGGQEKARASGDLLSDSKNVEVLGMSTVDGAPAYKLKVTHGAISEFHWVDKKSWLDVKQSPADDATAANAGGKTN
jgi:hypothetical protein